MRKILLVWVTLAALPLFADVYMIDGERVEGEVHDLGNGQRTLCNDTKCYFLPKDAVPVNDMEPAPADAVSHRADKAVSDSSQTRRDSASTTAPRLAQGYMTPAEFLAFLRDETAPDEADPFDGKSVWAILLLVLAGGLAMNLTPCVLPMVPINLMIIGKSATRGALYGLGIALAYGALGVLAAVGGLAFGTIQGNPWFNLALALLFLVLSLSLFGVFFLDFSRNRGALAQKKAAMLPGLFAFFMGGVSAVLAGACVAPILIAVLLLTAKLYAAGTALALGLPFVLGLGMALPWPFAGAGLKVLPKPGAWMPWVNRAFGLLVLGFAAWHGWLAYGGFAAENVSGEATPATFSLDGLKRPVLVDCWATWCKNCAAMEKTTLKDDAVAEELKKFTVVRLQAEDMSELVKLPGFESVKGLPAFVLFK